MNSKWVNTQLSKEEIHTILSKYPDHTIIVLDLEEWKDVDKPVQSFQKDIIEKLSIQFNDLKLEKFDYLDEVLERIDQSYNLNCVIVIENWHLLLEEKEYQRFLKSIFVNGILKRDIVLAILNGDWIHDHEINLNGFTEIQNF